MKTADGLNLFTPNVPGFDNLRAHMELSDEDFRKIKRGPGWRAVVFDHMSARRWFVKSAPCGAGCHCAAVIVQQEEEEQ